MALPAFLRPRRDVTLAEYRRWTWISSLVGIALITFGLYFATHRQIIIGLFLIVVGFAAGLWTASLRIDGTPGPLYKRDRAARELWTPRVIHFYTRKDCALCHEARTRLAGDLLGKDITIVDRDVDDDPLLQRRYGDRVPVAVYQGGEVFALAYDRDAVRAL